MRQIDHQRREELKKKQAAAGLVMEKLPEVAGIVITMTYYHRHAFSDTSSELMLRTVNVSPEDYAYFHMNCVNKDCTCDYDLTRVIRGMVKKRQKHLAGSMTCSGKGPDLPANHASIEYKIDMTFNRKKRKRS
jgi:hypothetical protein